MSAPVHIGKAGKALLGLGAVGAGVALLYVLLKKRVVGSDPSEWALPTFAPTTAFLNQPDCVCPSGTTPFRRADGSCNCEPLSIEVLPGYGGKCRSDAQCAVGICINGECRPESEWS